MKTSRVVTVLIAHHDQQVAQALADLIAAQPGMSVIGVAGDADGAVDIGCRHRPDVAMVDVNMPQGGGVVARELNACWPGCRIVSISAGSDPDRVVAMTTAGAPAFVLDDGDGNQILRALGSVLVESR